MYTDLADRIAASQKQLSAELASHAKALHETMRRDISIVDDQYKDLPGRVKRLEVAVFRGRRR
ncbi:MAG: hypothetical protein E6J90_25845 [Deltaproteobacteria bacterium]|nr:MAG: hypothetical protein E6J91_44485 [Deltaproteobacteria bacterium]TMQ15193.1 MAG: hypothetical protein E6J90_25845 [Deltaproteobacteria bacterium]